MCIIWYMKDKCA